MRIFVTSLDGVVHHAEATMENRDVATAIRIRIRQRPPRRGTRSEQAPRGGLFVILVMRGTQGGRWHAELMSGNSAAPQGRQLLCQSLGVTELADDAVNAFATLGIAVLASWRFVHECASHEHSWALM